LDGLVCICFLYVQYKTIGTDNCVPAHLEQGNLAGWKLWAPLEICGEEAGLSVPISGVQPHEGAASKWALGLQKEMVFKN
jgi:hypothetical protein